MRRLFLAVLACGLVVPLVWGEVAVAQEVGDTVDGAVWRFVMRSKAKRGETRGGRYRISNYVMYQKDSPKADSEEHVVGKSQPKGKLRSLVELDGLRTFPQNAPMKPIKVSGRILITSDKRGEWTGELVDQEGVHWEFKCVRIKE